MLVEQNIAMLNEDDEIVELNLGNLKSDDQQSTLIHGNSQVQSDLYLNNLDEEILSSHLSSDSSISSLSQDEDCLSPSKKDKRKQIRKAKKIEKKLKKKHVHFAEGAALEVELQ